MRKTAITYLKLVSIRIRAQMQYRVSFLLDALSTAVVSGVSFLTIALILQRFEGIGGWRLWEVAFLYGSVETGFGIMDLVFSGFDPPLFGRQVRMGTFDQMLLKPANILIQVLGSEFLIRRIGRILQGALVLGLALANLDIAWTLGKAVYLPLVIGGMVLFFGGLFVVGSTITFWTVDSIEAINVLTYGGTEMMTYPMQIYPDWLRQFFTYIVPGIFMNYLPALYILGKLDPLGLPAMTKYISPLVGAAVFAISLAFWKYGLKHYQSTGT